MSAVLPTDLPTASPWRSALPAIVAVIAALLLLFRETATVMVGIWWRSETFAHAFLVVPISLWLVWRLRSRLAALTPRAEPLFLVPMALALLAWFLAELVVVNAAAQFAFVAVLVLAVPAVLGRPVALAMLFPLLFLFFAVPFGEFMLPPMMEWTADFAVGALRLTGVPVYREGLHFVIPTGSWSVVTECSGVRYLIASFMVGSLFAYLNYRSWKRRALFMLVSLIVPIVANWMRAYIIVMMGHLSGNKLAAGVDHILYGWVFFGLVIFVMFSVGARWAEPDDAAAPAPHSAATPHALRALVVAGLAVVLAGALPHLVLAAMERAERSGSTPVLALPDELGVARASDTELLPGWKPNFNGPSAEARRSYRTAAGTVGVYLAYYRGQGQDRKLVTTLNGVVAINDRVWNAVGSGTHTVTAGDRTVTWRTVQVLGPPEPGARRPQMLAWQSYWIDGRFVAGDAAAKIATSIARLSGRGDDGAAVVLFTDQPTAAASAAALEAFAREHLGQIDALLARARDTR